MNRRSFLASLLKKEHASRRKSNRQRQRFLGRKILRMEPLEERTMLALIGVDSLADGPLDWSDGSTTLREALALAADETNYPGADQITFHPSLGLEATPGRITLTAGQLTLSSDVTLTGPGANSLTVDADGLSGVFYVNGGVTATIDGLTITGGNASSGGGVANYGTLTVDNVLLEGNTAGSGGGIYNSSGRLSITNSTLIGNSATSSGGGIYVGDGLLTLTNSTLAGNTGGSAGAIYSSGALTLANSILWGNSGLELGGSGSFDGWRNLIGINPGFVRNPSDGGDGWLDIASTTTVDEAANNDYGDLRLTERSPAVDYGDLSLLPLDAQDVDRDGNARIFGVAVDCGALEYQQAIPAGRELPSVVVTTTSDTVDLFDDQTSLREALYYADRSDLGMTVSFLATLDGQTLTLGGTMLWLDEPLTIDASALDSLTVDADGRSRVFRVIARDVVLDSLTITGGYADSGAGIYNSGTLTVRNSTLTDNAATNSGGGIYSYYGTLSVTNSTLSDNSAGSGGGIYNASGTVVVTDATLSDNSASSGGGIYASSGTVTVANSTLSGNSATSYGGGIYSSSCTLAVTNATFSHNSAGESGGGIYVPLWSSNYVITLSVTNSTFSNNWAGYIGGGIGVDESYVYEYSSTLLDLLSITNSTFSGNGAGYSGGGIGFENYLLEGYPPRYSVTRSGTLSIANSTFSGNWAGTSGGGIFSSSGSLTITNSTLAANSAGSGGAIYSNGALTLANSILWGNSGEELGGFVGLIGTRNLIGVEPGFVRNPSDGGDGWHDDPATTAVDEAANNDYGDLHLAGHSAAIDYGDNYQLPLDKQDLDRDGVTEEPIPVDRESHPRIVGAAVDCGAFEFQSAVPGGRELPSVVVTTASDTVDLYDGQLSLREAIYYAGIDALGMTVTFDATLDGATITLGGTSLWLDKPLTIDASALTALTVAADGSSRVFSAIASDVVLASLTITGGYADNGAGLYSSGSLALWNSTLIGNSATGSGGGIYASSGTLTVVNSIFSGNSAGSSGGGIYGSSGSLTVTNSTFVANTAGSASAIYTSGALTVSNSILWGNSGGEFGGSGSSVGTRDLVGVDPRFVRNPSDGGDGWRDDPSTPAVDEAANNDYGDLHLTDRSPAIDYGDASRLPPDAQDRDHDGVTDEPLPLDREGHPRVFGAAVDCGAFEFQGSPAHLETPSLVVTTASDTFDLLDGQTSLREAIYYAGVGDLGTTVTFAAALDGATIALGGAMLWLDKPLTIDASALPSLTVDAGGKSRVLRVTANDVVLDSLTITGGVADDGGGIYSSGRLTVRNSTLSGNSASSYGGGIYNSSGTLTVANATLSDNRASYGGGIYSSGTLSVT
ncbi:MAG: right-handed parallel beta-helix repeat-containing protein, partial [Planctomycetota bacterium]|nr:right-handed parallel beta-helix repeat-containing protein [Planctomycetota bacterium]